MFPQTPRAKAVDLRTYCRPLDEEGSAFESREQMIKRAYVEHHKQLYRSNGRKPDGQELAALERLALEGKSSLAGRTQWLGGTPYAHERACCQFNCAYSTVDSVYSLVDVAWMLLNGSGVGFSPRAGVLHGYTKPIPELVVVPSERPKDHRGRETNEEVRPDASNDHTWTIRVGDSAVAWAKAGGKLFSFKGMAKRLVLDFSEVRGPGGRLKGYGWICNGHEPLALAFRAIHNILNDNAGNLLDEVQIMDVVNWWGSVLSSRRSAQLCQLDEHNPRIPEYQRAKYKYWETNPQRRQSNNGISFWSKPSKARIEEVLRHADECGGCPSMINASALLDKAGYGERLNPCAETILANRSVCNVVTNCLPRFRKKFAELERAIYTISRANYRQTCVDMRDGVLTPEWHQTNESLRLCGVSLTGIVQADWLSNNQIRRMRNAAITGTYSMADEWGLPRPKAVTLGKPEGTGSKAFGGLDVGEIAEGMNRPLGRYILNWINFSMHDPLVGLLEAAGYRSLPNPSDPNNVLVCFPVEYNNIRFDVVEGKEVNLEPATAQLDRYLRWTTLWADHNMSCTISYSPHEIEAIVDWVDRNWDLGFLAVSFLRRNDPTKTARDLGHPYLPQEVTTEGPFREYQAQLRDVDWAKVTGLFEIYDASDCTGGVCPAR